MKRRTWHDLLVLHDRVWRCYHWRFETRRRLCQAIHERMIAAHTKDWVNK